ncbi:hypothetical protein POM88_029085 [Heracleum sosnowskyi]|uniref:Protein FAR1-RELATED SEQUENCE n=1 Tax=Heracleum sosnowskyi TaxID=360622 RepID=A0AAD8HT02_9APIA|nr:hypothetical protein POM88_029085 [Heracleum sosnowskyi]
MDNESVTAEGNREASPDVEVQDEIQPNISIPHCNEEIKPYKKQVFPDLDTAFEHYEHYGRECGFTIRRSTEKTNNAGKTILKYFVCSRTGPNDYLESARGNSSYKHRNRKTVSAKCICPTKLSLRAVGENSFLVYKFIETHNHPFASKSGMQFLRCNRSLTDFHQHFIVDAGKVNIGATRAHGFYKSLCGSYENVGATVVDFKKISRDFKKKIGKHDADLIVQKFKDIQLTYDGAFKYEYETDSSNRLTRLFWADGIGRQNYEVFGDVVSFDAIYRTNRYSMVFVPLIGIDNHWKSVTFAGALLESESSENFTWYCESYKKIFGKEPKCIITDQCAAMKIAIENCFPLVKHRLCMWNIMKKLPAKLGTLFCVESPFMDKLNKFVWSDHVTPTEFEDGWNEVISEFGLSDNKWLQEMFDLRKSWIPAYFNDEPMVGLLRTTSRSESSNFFFNHFVQKGDTLSEFYLCYESAIERQRYNNKKLNHADDIMPRPISKKKIETDVAEMYTRTMFYKIQEEILAGGGDIEIESWNIVDGVKTISIKDPISLSKSFQKAEERFSTLELGDIPEPMSREKAQRPKAKDCWFEFQGCISSASGNQDHIDYIHKVLKLMRNNIRQSQRKGNSRLDDESVEDLIGSKIVEETTILPPNQSNNKGCRKRITSSAEKSIGCKKRQMRECKTCKEMTYHDSRNCPKKNNTI